MFLLADERTDPGPKVITVMDSFSSEVSQLHVPGALRYALAWKKACLEHTTHVQPWV